MSDKTEHDFAPHVWTPVGLSSGTIHLNLLEGGSGCGGLAGAGHHKALEKSRGIKGQSCPMLQLSHKAMQ